MAEYSEKCVAMVIRNFMLRLRVSKIEQWEALLVEIIEHPSMSARTSYISILTVGTATDVTREGVVYGLNVL